MAQILVVGSLVSCNNDDVIVEEPGGSGHGALSQRPVTPESKADCNHVFEWMAAPGQFINEPSDDIAWTSSTTQAEANRWAMKRLQNRYDVSLGAFGGYLIVGFDHSIVNTGGDYEIGVFGNAFISHSGRSNEPGIVYVMQDSNGNGEPDDIWYELRGSDTFAKGTRRDYNVTYYRPDADGASVKWTDNLGNSGEIVYNAMFHAQPTYYPVWVDGPSYTLSGTCLEAKTWRNPETGNWENPPFGWGYADNLGDDNIVYDGLPNCNRFKISDAIDRDGKAVKLDFIDFVKIQTGVCSSSGWLGEVSTEVCGVVDLQLNK